MGPNFNKLVFIKSSILAIPDGGDLADVLIFLTNPDKFNANIKEAQVWVTEAIAVVKTAPDNPYGNDDEAIAEEILKQISQRITPKSK